MVLSDHLLRHEATWDRLHDQTKIILRQMDAPAQAVPATRQRQRRLTAAEQVDVARRYQAGMLIKDLAVEFGVHRHTITQCLRRLAIPLCKQGLQPEDFAEAARLYREGWSLFRIGQKFGCDHTDARRKLIACGVQMRPRRGWNYDK